MKIHKVEIDGKVIEVKKEIRILEIAEGGNILKPTTRCVESPCHKCDVKVCFPDFCDGIDAVNYDAGREGVTFFEIKE